MHDVHEAYRATAPSPRQVLSHDEGHYSVFAASGRHDDSALPPHGNIAIYHRCRLRLRARREMLAMPIFESRHALSWRVNIRLDFSEASSARPVFHFSMERRRSDAIYISFDDA